ncbi:MAG: aspartate--tRNA ligase [Candidatus Diapherotrites archaeon]|nr:aspartate--tRNA ligase [Candidatus Diapherotrites archaeon]
MERTHYCGNVRAVDAGKGVVIFGWVSNKRDHGGLTFIDLRDRAGFVQVVFNGEKNHSIHGQAKGLSAEDVICVHGSVLKRPKGTENKGLPTGEVEVEAKTLELLNKSLPVPLEVTEHVNASEETRLKYRFLDLRRHSMQEKLLLRHKLTKVVRDYFDSHGFLEIETPILAKSTPEGARDYLVPSRVNPGRFFALPQSPQLFKQLLMVSGCDRYFQIARCFRDEDLRADRQPEFTQIDVEMSFISEEDIFEIVEGLVKEIFSKTINVQLKQPFPRMSYDEAMERFGVDAPDTRYGLELVDVSKEVENSDFNVFKDCLKSGGMVKSINLKSCGGFSKKEIEELTEFVKIYKAKGLAWLVHSKQGFDGPVKKFFPKKTLDLLAKKLGAGENDLLVFVADKPSIVNPALGYLRKHVAKKTGLVKENVFNFVWVYEFPLLFFNEEENRLESMHHPFTSPKPEHVPLLEKEPLKVRARAYDLVLNGIELGGGSIRIHSTELQQKMFDVLGISRPEAEARFGFFLEALKYGTPPHGGIAFGLDRIAMLLAGADSIREVIAFPKNKSAVSLMDGAPSEVSEKQLRELRIKLDFSQKKG